MANDQPDAQVPGNPSGDGTPAGGATPAGDAGHRSDPAAGHGAPGNNSADPNADPGTAADNNTANSNNDTATDALPNTGQDATHQSDTRQTQQEEAPELAPGATVGGRYRLVTLVTTDHAGNRFWRARDTVLPRDMAITLLPDSSGASATVARTLRAGRLHHIGLPQTLDLGTDHGQTFVVGQWVDGATLTDLLSHGPLEPAVASSIAGRLADAVAEAHRNGLALGSITPSLIRVNVDGQVRFSHVIAHAAAAPDADIRAVGGLLYLMLTGLWPASNTLPALTEPGIRSAPMRDGREAPADEVNPAVPPALAQLTERALHPEDPDGISAVAALATLLRTPENAAGGFDPRAAATPAHGPVEPPPTMSPADKRLRRERRLKLSVAVAFLAAFVALILIVVGTLARNTLADIDRSNKSDLGLITTGSSTTARATTVAGGAPAASGAASSGPQTSGSPSSSAAPSAPVAIVGGQVYDPNGTGKPDNPDLVDLLWDKNAAKGWQTDQYKQQFGPNGYKTGVGVTLQFDKPVKPTSVTVTPALDPTTGQAATQGMQVQIRSADSINPPLDATQVLAQGTINAAPAEFPINNAPTSQYLIVFVTKTVDNAPGGRWWAQIGEVSVQGTQ